MRCFALAFLLVPATAAIGGATQDTWSYVVPPAGAEHRRPPLKALALGAELPEGVELDVAFRGDFQRYAQLRYGDEDSRRVTVVLDHHGQSSADLYVDAGRDMIISADDRVGETGDAWETSIAVSTKVDDELELLPRRVAFQLGKTGSIFSYATLGYLEGAVTAGERALAVRRKDGDGNGFFTDHRDQLWFDLDGSGTWAAMEELFLYAPVLTLDGQRWALKSDRAGASLTLEKIDGIGRIHLALPEVPGDIERTITGLNVLLVGKDGSAASVRSLGQPVEVPVGEYRVGMVTLRARYAAGGQPWSFVFSEPGARSDLTWYPIAKDQDLTIDPIGELAFSVGDSKDTCAAGDRLDASPRLYTGDGLLINTAYQGKSAPSFMGTLSATVRLSDAQGNVIDTSHSGFA